MGTLTWLGQAYTVTCKSCEVSTLRLGEREGRWTVRPCDMIEREAP